MIHSVLATIMALSISASADFQCPDETIPLEKKSEVQWMKACQDQEGKLHGLFEIWTRLPASMGLDSTFHKMTAGSYSHGIRIGKWEYWGPDGEKVSETVYP